MQCGSWFQAHTPQGRKTTCNGTANLRALNVAALAVYRKGHVPVIGINVALPIIEAAGANGYDEDMMPLSLAIAEKCDACLRIGGPFKGADEEVERFKVAGRPTYLLVDEIPPAKSAMRD